jgi:hypothetical protein
MKCAVHTEADATGFCRNCGKALCPACTREVSGMLYCEACLASLIAHPAIAGAPSGANPGLAAAIGIIPGLGAVYNGQYMKALIHVLVFAAFIGLLSGNHPDPIVASAGCLLAAFIVYMMVDAYRVAKAKVNGQVPPDISGMPTGKAVGPFILIGLGLVFLLENFGLLNLDRLIDVWWPLILIGAGALLAWRHMGSNANR